VPSRRGGNFAGTCSHQRCRTDKTTPMNRNGALGDISFVAHPLNLLNSHQAPNSAQTWLPNKSSSALDVVPKPCHCETSNHTSAPSLPRRPCLALHPCALPVHQPSTTAKASTLASLMSGVATRDVISKCRTTHSRPARRACGERQSPCPNRVRPVRPLDEAVLTIRETSTTGHQPEAIHSQRTWTPGDITDAWKPSTKGGKMLKLIH